MCHNINCLLLGFMQPTKVQMIMPGQGLHCWGAGGAMAPRISSKSLDYQKFLLCWKIVVLLQLVKIRVWNFIGKSLNLAPLIYRCHDAPVPGVNKAPNDYFEYSSSKVSSRHCANWITIIVCLHCCNSFLMAL